MDAERWLFDKRGLTISFDPYDIAACAYGAEEATIPGASSSHIWSPIRPSFSGLHPPRSFGFANANCRRSSRLQSTSTGIGDLPIDLYPAPSVTEQPAYQNPPTEALRKVRDACFRLEAHEVLFTRVKRVIDEPALMHSYGRVYAINGRDGPDERIVLPLATDGKHADGIIGVTTYRLGGGLRSAPSLRAAHPVPGKRAEPGMSKWVF